jgi:lysophospholipase L1-like esterase
LDSLYSFFQEIKAFKILDSIAFPAKGQVLLIGSSSFTKWKDVQDYFPGASILNRGFGGSSLPDLIRYKADIVYPYQPKKIIIYCGENDFAGNASLPPDSVVLRFKMLFFYIRARYPKVPIAYISMKPSPSRTHLFPKFIEANKKIQSFLRQEKYTTYLDVYKPMMNAEGRPKPEIFGSDSLHMNAKGYAIWQNVRKKSINKK